MGTCASCGKQTSLLFDEETEPRCWLCLSRDKVRMEEESGEDDEYAEKRIWKRFPVQMHIKIHYGSSESSMVIFPGATVNLSQGGVCIEWTPCEVCAGYRAGGLDPQCIFARYDMNISTSELLILTLFLSEEEYIEIQTKVVFILKQPDGTEFVGMAFSNLDEETKQKVSEILNQVAENGQA